MAASGNEATIVATVPGIVKFGRGIAEGMPVSKGGTVFTIRQTNFRTIPHVRLQLHIRQLRTNMSVQPNSLKTIL